MNLTKKHKKEIGKKREAEKERMGRVMVEEEKNENGWGEIKKRQVKHFNKNIIFILLFFFFELFLIKILLFMLFFARGIPCLLQLIK